MRKSTSPLPHSHNSKIEWRLQGNPLVCRRCGRGQRVVAARPLFQSGESIGNPVSQGHARVQGVWRPESSSCPTCPPDEKIAALGHRVRVSVPKIVRDVPVLVWLLTRNHACAGSGVPLLTYLGLSYFLGAAFAHRRLSGLATRTHAPSLALPLPEPGRSLCILS